MDNRSLLGLVGYYQRYVPNYYQVASTLTDALRKGELINVLWDTTKEDAIQGLKKVLISRPVLRAPDHSKEFVVQCHASDRGMAVVLSQVGDDHEEHPIFYASRKLTEREEAYRRLRKGVRVFSLGCSKAVVLLVWGEVHFRDRSRGFVKCHPKMAACSNGV